MRLRRQKDYKKARFWFKSNNKMNFLSIAYFIATISAAPTPESNTASKSQAVTQGRLQFLRADHTKVETSGPINGCFGIQGEGSSRLQHVLELSEGAAVFYYSDFNCARPTRLNEYPQNEVGATPYNVSNAGVKSIRIVPVRSFSKKTI
jgi:hypothetical protein